MATCPKCHKPEMVALSGSKVYLCSHCRRETPSNEIEQMTELKDDTPALDVQVGGSHYKTLAIQPVEYIHKNGIGYMEGSAIKYLTRWRNKGGIEDLKKARHFIDLLIEMESTDR